MNHPGRMVVLRTVAEAGRLGRNPAAPRPLGLVPTMGYLHQGHLSLVRESRRHDACTVVSIFVNPTQFGRSEDLSRYPRDEARDLAMLEAERVDYVFAPTAPEEIYPAGFDTWVEPGSLQHRLEGAIRPGHFRGVCTVVAKLLNILRPDRAYFGQKDYQQCVVVRRMVADLALGPDIRVLPTVREPDGLAMSSRNVYLSPPERRAATALYRALEEARALVARGERRAELLRCQIAATIGLEPLAQVDYISISHPDTLEEQETALPGSVALVAARLGRTRLLDNILLP